MLFPPFEGRLGRKERKGRGELGSEIATTERDVNLRMSLEESRVQMSGGWQKGDTASFIRQRGLPWAGDKSDRKLEFGRVWMQT